MADKKCEKIFDRLEAARPMTFEEIQDFLKKCKPFVYRDLACRVCGWYCHPWFIACEGTHLICKECHRKNNVCDICETMDQPLRLYFLERVHSFMEFPCVYKKYGCKYRDIGGMIIYHEEDCELYVTQCPDPTCYWEGNPREIFPHYRQTHSSRIKEDEEEDKHLVDVTRIGEYEIITNILERFDLLFMVQIIVQRKKHYLYIVATNFEPYRHINDYFMTMRFTLKDGTVWTAAERFEFTRNGEEINLTNKICYGKKGEFKEKTKRITYFDLDIQIDKIQRNPNPDDASSDEDRNEYADFI